jgi:polar amino acid transport system substrate-binding protein
LLPGLALIGLVLALAARPAGAQAIQIAYPEEGGIAQGPGHFAFDFLRAAELVANDSGLDVTWKALPIARMMHQVQVGQTSYCVGGAGITAERAAIGQFTRPYINDRMLAVVALKIQQERLGKAQDFRQLVAQGKQIFLGLQGANYGELIAPQLAQLKDRISYVPHTTEQMLEMLQRGRADYGLVMKTYTGNYLAARRDHDNFILVSYPDLRRDFRVAFLCSRSVPAATIDRLNAAIARQLPRIRQLFPEQQLDSN